MVNFVFFVYGIWEVFIIIIIGFVIIVFMLCFYYFFCMKINGF